MPEDKKPVVSLKSLMTPSKTVSIPYPGCEGMTVDLCYLAREELVKLRKKCLSTKWNKKTRQPEEELHEDKVLVNYWAIEDYFTFVFNKTIGVKICLSICSYLSLSVKSGACRSRPTS